MGLFDSGYFGIDGGGREVRSGADRGRCFGLADTVADGGSGRSRLSVRQGSYSFGWEEKEYQEFERRPRAMPLRPEPKRLWASGGR